MTITKSKEMIIDEKQFDSDASQNRKPGGKLFILFSSLVRHSYNTVSHSLFVIRVDAANRKHSVETCYKTARNEKWGE